MGYSFSNIHALAYSFIGYQTAYLSTKWNPIYWNTACLMVNSGSLEDHSETEIVDIYEPEYQELSEGTTYVDLPDRSGKIKKTTSTDYEKLAKAIGNMKEAGIKISLVDINNSDFSFVPDINNNQILFGLKGMLNINDELVKTIIANRPYSSPKDFYYKVRPKRPAMISLIKGGAFDSMEERKFVMAWFLWETCDKKSNLTLQNMPTLKKYNLLPEDTEERLTARRVYEFNRYLKLVCAGKDKKTYILDDRAISFMQEMGFDNMISSDLTLDANIWDKKGYQPWMNVYRKWMSENKQEILDKLNKLIFTEEWNNYAEGTISKWEMDVLCFYYHEHELINVNKEKYGIAKFNKLSPQPIVDKSFVRGGKEIKLFKLDRICGTCIAKNKNKALVTLLTTDGVVTLKFSKEYFSMFDKQISERGEDGKKHVLEKSWFNRGSMIVVTGMRSDDMFIVKKYSATPGHRLYKIDEIKENGDLILRHERLSGEEEESEN